MSKGERSAVVNRLMISCRQPHDDDDDDGYDDGNGDNDGRRGGTGYFSSWIVKLLHFVEDCDPRKMKTMKGKCSSSHSHLLG